MVELGNHIRICRRLIGMFAKKLNVQEGVFDKTKTAIFAIANVAAHVIGWVS